MYYSSRVPPVSKSFIQLFPDCTSTGKMSTIEVELFRATAEDSATVYEYLVKHYDFHVSTGPPVNWRITEKVVKENIGAKDDPSKFFEAIQARDKSTGQVMGQVCYYKLFDFYYGKTIEVEQILVEEKYRSNKIGLKLMKEVAKVAAADNCVMTWKARAWNTKAHKFYESIGGQKLKDIHSSNGAHHVQYFMFEDAIQTLSKSED